MALDALQERCEGEGECLRDTLGELQSRSLRDERKCRRSSAIISSLVESLHCCCGVISSCVSVVSWAPVQRCRACLMHPFQMLFFWQEHLCSVPILTYLSLYMSQ
jgi:hypothetical protein